MTIGPGSRVLITDVEGNEHEVVALSGVVQKGRSFPVVWVNRPLDAGEFEPTPWPADAVKEANA